MCNNTAAILPALAEARACGGQKMLSSWMGRAVVHNYSTADQTGAVPGVTESPAEISRGGL